MLGVKEEGGKGKGGEVKEIRRRIGGSIYRSETRQAEGKAGFSGVSDGKKLLRTNLFIAECCLISN